ncbi:hypothetical protein ACFX16_001210 [Malus domestica]
MGCSAWQHVGFAWGLSGLDRLALGLGPCGLEWHGLGRGYGAMGLVEGGSRGGLWGWWHSTHHCVEPRRSPQS